MGMVKTEITLKNARDEGKVNEGLIKSDEVRSITVTAVVDTGSKYLVINEELREKLGLFVVEEGKVNIANGQQAPCGITEPLFIHWKNRKTSCPAVVIHGAKSILLGFIPLECMDLIVNPATQEVVGEHGEEEVIYCL